MNMSVEITPNKTYKISTEMAMEEMFGGEKDVSFVL